MTVLAAHWMLDHVTHRDPYPVITAPLPKLREYTSWADENRAAYIAQSAATVGGQVAPFQLTERAGRTAGKESNV